MPVSLTVRVTAVNVTVDDTGLFTLTVPVNRKVVYYGLTHAQTA